MLCWLILHGIKKFVTTNSAWVPLNLKLCIHRGSWEPGFLHAESDYPWVFRLAWIPEPYSNLCQNRKGAQKNNYIQEKRKRKKKKNHIRTRYSVKILNSTPKSPNNLFIYLKEETSHTPQNWKVYEIIIIVSPESLTGWQGWKLP